MFFIIREGFKNIRHNFFYSLCTFGVMFISLLLLGISSLVTLSFTIGFDSFYQKESNIMVFVESAVSQEQLEKLNVQLKGISGVESVEYISNDDGLKDQKEKGYLTSDLYKLIKEKNPLPHTFIVKPKANYDAELIYSNLSKTDGVVKIQYAKEALDKAKESGTKFERILAYSVFGLVFLSMFLIMIVTSLTVQNKTQDVKIMLLTGAPMSCIKGPFMLEGILIGFLSSLSSAFVVYYAYDKYVLLLKKMFSFLKYVNFYNNQLTVLIFIVTFGTLLGYLGSYLATKYSVKKIIKQMN